MSQPNKEELKERERTNWSSAAEGWKRRDALLSEGAAPVTRRMLELAGIQAGSHLLDIASGTGEPAISAARIVGESGKVIGTDLVDEMLAVAREKIARESLGNIEFHCCDAEQLEHAPNSFDAVTIRWGLMFMPEPGACLVSAYQSLKPGGRISLACWAAPEKNPFVGVMLKVLANYMELPKPPPGTPGIFAFADPQRLQQTIADAGFTDIVLEDLEIDVIEVDDGRAYWETMSDLAAPVMALVKQLDDAAREAYISDVIKTADAMKEGETLRMKGVTWVASGAKA